MTEFWTICSSNGIILDLDQLNQYERYYEELLYWNNKVNLISRKDIENVYEKHILHSLVILKYVDLKAKAMCLDIGTGGGFPGIPIGIARKDLKIEMIDSIAKKLKLTDMFAKHTGNRNFSTLNIRAEELSKDEKNHKKYDYIFARAVTRTVNLIDWSNKLLKDDGKFVFLKGGKMVEELAEAQEKYPNYKFDLIPIDFIGLNWLKNEDKRVLIIEKA